MTPDLVGGLESPDYASHDKAAHGEPYTPVFTGEVRRELDTLLTRYPTKMAALLPALWIVQREHRWVSEEAMEEVAGLLELTPAYVKGVVTFYTMYHQHPVGKYFIQVCTTSPCGLCGAEDTVIEVECLGACGFATPVMVNEEFIESVTPDKVPDLLARLA